jgi:hypothetical protein
MDGINNEIDWEKNPEDVWILKPYVIEKISLIQLIGEYNLKFEKCSGDGKFSWKLRCPFHIGKNGGVEKTPSLFISREDNSFFCFSCGSVGSAISFVSLIEKISEKLALEKLAKKLNLIDNDGKICFVIENKEQKPMKLIDEYIVDCNILLREYGEFSSDYGWVDKIGKKLDDFFDTLEFNDGEKAEKAYLKLIDKIKKKKKGK